MSDAYSHPDLPKGAPQYTLQQLMEQVRTGDIIMWCGRGNFSGAVRFSTASAYTHVGLVRVVIDPNTHERTVYYMESTQSYDPADYFYCSGLSSRGCVTQEPRNKTGPKLSLLAEKLYSYEGVFLSVRHLGFRKSAFQPDGAADTLEKQRALSLQLKQRLDTFLEEVVDMSYETDPVELLAAVARLNCADNARSYICSKLTMQQLRRAGVCGLDSHVLEHASNALPKDFAYQAGVSGVQGRDPLDVQAPWYYGPEIFARLPKDRTARHW